MFEARFTQGDLLKRVIDSMKDLVGDANFDCSAAGVSLQAMDATHVSVVEVLLRADGFAHYRCDRGLTMGMHIGSLSKILKLAGNGDIITMTADDTGDTVSFMFESPEQERMAEFELKLMDIDAEQLAIPDTKYSATPHMFASRRAASKLIAAKVRVHMPSAEFSRLMKELASIGDTVVISVTKDGIKFSTPGELGTAHVTVRQHTAVKKAADATTIDLVEPVTLTFGLKFLNSFIKATPLSPTVKLRLEKEMPLAVEYKIGTMNMEHIKFYLAPKIEDEEAEG